MRLAKCAGLWWQLRERDICCESTPGSVATYAWT